MRPFIRLITYPVLWELKIGVTDNRRERGVCVGIGRYLHGPHRFTRPAKRFVFREERTG